MVEFAKLPDDLAQRIANYKKDHPKTNYDRIISKTPEELAQLIMSIEPAACPFRGDHGDDCQFTHCEKCWLDWLKRRRQNERLYLQLP